MTCINHADRTAAGTYNETFNVTVPASSGTYNGYFVAYSDDTCNSAASTTFAMTGAVTILSLTEFNSTGGTSATNGLHFYLEDTTKIQVRRLNNTGQVYEPGTVPPSDILDNGVFIRANGSVYGPSNWAYTPNGGMYNTYSITQASPANPTTSGIQQTATGTFGINAGPQVSVLWKYTTPLDFLTAEVTLTIPAGYAVSAANPVRYYHVFDTYLGGSDSGCGVSFLDNGKRVIGTYPPSSGTTCPSSTAIPTGVSVVESFRERSGQTFSSYCASGWATFFDTSTPNCSVRQAATMSNTVVTTYQDTGIGVELDFTAPGTYTFSYDFVVGTPLVPDYDHIEIRHDGSAGLCSESVTVLACTSSSVPCPALDIVNTGTLTGAITTSPTSPTVTKTPATFTLGSSASTQNISLLASGAGTFTLGASGMSATPLNGTKCWNTTTSTASCTLTVTNTPCLGGYECIETGSTYNNLNTSPSARNPLFTKLSGTGFKFDVVALQSSGAVATSYTASSNVTVELFNDSASPQPSCGAYSGPVASQAITFAAADNGRKTLASNISVSRAYSRLRCRVTDSNVSPTIYACSSDSFAVRPPAVALSTTASAVAPSSTATTTVQAGTSFTLGATTSAGTNYQGSLALDTSKLTAQTTTQDSSQASGGTVGTLTLTPSTLPTNPATASSNNAKYSEVGYLYLAPGALRDDSFTAVDSATGDCVTSTTSNANLADTLDASGKYGCSIGNKTAVSLGRFIPHHFDTTVTQGCAPSGFTYSGQPFVVTATAQQSGGGTTSNYRGVFAKAATVSNAGSTTNMTGNTIASTAFSNGVGSANVTYTFASRTTAPTGLTLRAADGEVTSSGASEGTATIRSGRVRLRNAYGSERLASGLPVPVVFEYYDAPSAATAGWRTGTDACTVLAPSQFAYVYSGGAFSACRTAGTAMGANPTPTLTLAQPNGNAVGWVNVTLNLGATAAGSTCTSTNAGTGFTGSATTANAPWLQFDWSGAGAANPSARATFGVYKSPLLYRRENY